VPQDLPRTICKRLYQDEDIDASKNAEDLDSPVADVCKVEDFLDCVFDDKGGSEYFFADMLPDTFGEVHPKSGIYEALKMESERKRAIAAMLSVIYLIQDDYDRFTDCQRGGDKMSREMWAAMQRFKAWAGVTKEAAHAVLVFLAIRGIGKSQPLISAMHRDEQTPEVVVQRLIASFPTKVPSCQALSATGRSLVERALDIHRAFNFGHFLQGENTPRHVGVLQGIIKEEGTEVLRFYLLSLVGVMCGLRGEESMKGSLFMSQSNVVPLMKAISVLQRLESANPSGIYWGYISLRAAELHIPANSIEQLAFARLACLSRAKESDIAELQGVWAGLSRADREALAGHLVADGINSLAFAFAFLPKFIANARANPAVGLHRALAVLVELIDSLEKDGYAEKIGAQMLCLNLQDLADFAETVENAGAFMVVQVHSSIVRRGDTLDVIVSPRHKQHSSQTNWSDDPINEMRALMRRMDRRVVCVNEQVERLQDYDGLCRSAPGHRH